ncbi:hypothetical protein PoB_000686800 [Plakobranchus ocellatus]|uniref:Uncharacterized protein n=1 Tax=Plakobranchus ocellatus TaxID=259542 RepID=A0AAV3YDZ8_9GAST|nr:hypothetical protein PoB_000686800 [Plakobranchus ocellatus]
MAGVNKNTILYLFSPLEPITSATTDAKARSDIQHPPPTIFEKNAMAPESNKTSSEVSSLAFSLRERLNIPNDAIRILYNNSCKLKSTIKPCQDPLCHSLNKTIEKRLEDILSPNLQLSKSQLNTILSIGKTIPMSDVIIASAVSANHYEEMQAMFKALHEQVYPKLLNFTMVLFDLGLKPHQWKMTKKNCRCRLISFNFDLFPPHVRDLHCYSWKPIIIRAVASKATTLVVWQDASVRWRDGFKIIFQRAALYGQQIVVTDHADRVTSNTVKEMFQYMNEDVCRFHNVPEIANAMALHRPDPLIVRTIMDPWARCALESECMCPAKYDVWTIRHCNNYGTHRCHRFDQSALTLLTAKLYEDERYKIEIPEQHKHVRVMRGDRLTDYFTP